MGVKTVTIENLVVEKVVADKNVLMIKGNVPGAKNSLIVVKSSAKASKQEGGLKWLISNLWIKTATTLVK